MTNSEPRTQDSELRSCGVFVTVGAQMPFDRMVRAVDEWAAARERDDVLAQIGPTDWRPSHIRWTEFMDPADFRRMVENARVVVAHAGMGSIITALELGKPILVMPRRGDLRETRNDHQVATAKRFLEQGRVAVAFDEQELSQRLEEIDALAPGERIESHASQRLLATIRSFIEGDALQPNHDAHRVRADATERPAATKEAAR